MKTLLVIGEESGLAAAIRAVVSAERYRVVGATGAHEIEPLLEEGMVSAIVLDAELTSVRPILLLEQLKRRLPRTPILVFAGASQWEWEEEAWLLGVSQILTKPVRGRLLNHLLDRLWLTESPSTPPSQSPAATPTKTLAQSGEHLQTLEVLRSFSSILSHSLHSDAFLREFLLLLRGVLGVNRAAIFLRPPPAALNAEFSQLSERRLRTACALGLSASLLEHFTLSLDSGIGQFAHRRGRILRRQSEEASADGEIQQEFDLLGAQVAIPILDRETFIGVAIFDGPLTGEPFANGELTLVFHLLEELGLALRNSWLHDLLSANHSMMSEILDQMGSACLVVCRDLEVLHANLAARSLFGRGTAKARVQFSDLPQPLGTLVYQALAPGADRNTSKYRFAQNSDSIYRVNVTPFRRNQSAQPNAALLVIEDITQNERAHNLAIEAASLRLVRNMAEHLAHEIGNSLAPLSAHQQLMKDRQADPEFQTSLSEALAVGVERIARLSRQMQHLAGNGASMEDRIRVADLLNEAFEEVGRQYKEPIPRMKLGASAAQGEVMGSRLTLRVALQEVLLNAFQAAPQRPEAEVRINPSSHPDGSHWVVIEVQDSGPGFEAEVAERATEPFFSTKIVGLGLGLTVARKIIESHGGHLEIAPRTEARAGLVRLVLPMAPF